jgi:hypothetical protein
VGCSAVKTGAVFISRLHRDLLAAAVAPSAHCPRAPLVWYSQWASASDRLQKTAEERTLMCPARHSPKQSEGDAIPNGGPPRQGRMSSVAKLGRIEVVFRWLAGSLAADCRHSSRSRLEAVSRTQHPRSLCRTQYPPAACSLVSRVWSGVAAQSTAAQPFLSAPYRLSRPL